MSSYLSNLLTTTTSRYNSLRRTLLSDEADGDTEDDSHVSRVLRAYYTEKGRPFPSWLPPDPKAPQAQPAQFVASSGRLQQQQGQAPPSRGGGLGDLWGEAPPQPQQPQGPTSLRRQAQGRGGLMPGMQQQEPAPQSRPLPSQRAGSYQTQFAQQQTRPSLSSTPSNGSSGTAQERLKARLWGSGRSTSPAPSGTTSTSNPSPGVSPPLSQVGARNPYDRGNSYTPPARSSVPYPDDRSSSGGYQKPVTSANAPWANGGDDHYAGAYDNNNNNSGYSAPRPSGRDRVGLPSGPRMMR